MAGKPSVLAAIFDDAPAALPRADAPPRARARRDSHPGKKPVLIHIPEDMHRALRRLSVEEDGEPLTVITERLLRQYLVARGHVSFAP